MNIIKHLKRPVLIGVILIAVIAYFYFGKEKLPNYEMAETKKGNVQEIVSINGSLESNAVMSLRFQQYGKIERLPFDVGDKVLKGNILAELENDVLEIATEQARAGLDIANAELNLRKAGPTSEDMEIYQSYIKEAEVNLDNAMLKKDDNKLLYEQNIENSKIAMENAVLKYKTAELLLKNAKDSGTTSSQKSTKNLESAYNASKNEILNIINSLRATITLLDTIVGVDQLAANDTIEESIKTPSAKNYLDAQANYTYLKRDLVKLEDQYKAMESLAMPTEYDPVAIEDVSKKAEDLIALSQSTLNSAELLLDLSYLMLSDALSKPDIYNIGTYIQTKMTQINNEQTKINGHMTSLERISQNLAIYKIDLLSTETNTTSSIDQAQIAIMEAQNAMNQARNAQSEAQTQATVNMNRDQMEVDVAEARYKKAKADYAKLIASPRSVDLASLQARVRQETARYNQALKELENTRINAPVDGVITKVSPEVGENVSASEDVISLMTDLLQIKANISETDIAKVRVNDTVEITLDAFSSDRVLKGKVQAIDPAETVVQGVIYYQTTIFFDEEYEDLKSGMTANLEILTKEAKNVLTIPPEAVQYDNGSDYVYVLENGEKAKRVIKIGIEGEDAVELIEGLKEGEKVVLYEK